MGVLMGVLLVGGKVALSELEFESALMGMLGWLFLPEEVELLFLGFVVRMAFLLFQRVVVFLGLDPVLGVLPWQVRNL